MLNHSSSAQDLVILSATSVSLGPVLLCFLSTFIFPFFIREWVCHETRQKALRYQKRKRRKKDLVFQKKARCNAEVSGIQHELGRDARWVGRAILKNLGPDFSSVNKASGPWSDHSPQWSFLDFSSFVCAPHCYKLYLLRCTVTLRMVGGARGFLQPAPTSHPTSIWVST